MQVSVSVFIATSLDGFIARENGELDWLDEANATVPEGEDCGYRDFMGSIDALIMGRHTYEKVLSFGPWPYGATPVIVLSHQPIEFPADFPDCVSHSSETPQELCDRLSTDGATHLYVDGGITIQRFLQADLIDELTVTVIPVILGAGIPLFGPLEDDIPLSHCRTRTFDCGFVQTKYRVTNRRLPVSVETH